MKFTEILEQVGLSEAEAKVYNLLLEAGQATAPAIIKKAAMKRPTVYHILNQLIKRGLVEEVRGPSKKEFRVTPPENLEKIVAFQEANVTRAKKVLEYSLPDMVSQYMLSLHRPNVAHYEGVAGLDILHEDVIREKKDIMLIRSPHDVGDPEVERKVVEHIRARVRHSIHTRTITQLAPDTLEVMKKDAERMVTRRIIPPEKLSTKAQILIYGNKVALTSYEKPILTTIIENTQIRDTFIALFEYIWDAAEAEHGIIVQNVSAARK